MLLKTLFVIFIPANLVYSCEESESDVTDTSYVSAEYLNIFRTIPALFEYVLDIIEQKPGILEKDDVTVFTEDGHYMFDRTASVDDDVNNLDRETNDAEQLQLHLLWDRYPGVFGNKRLGLSPAEVADLTLEVEKQLEEHNDIKSRK